METMADYQHFLPAEILLNIFSFIDAPTLVFDCRGVCKFWKDTVESSDMWKINIRHLTLRNKELDSALPTAHNVYPWYICYALCKNVFGRNLIVGNVPEIRPSIGAYLYLCGMIYYSAMGTNNLGFSLPPQEILDEEANFCFLAPFGDCSVKYTVDMYRNGFTKKILELQPPVVINVWLTVRHNFLSFHSLNVTLLNSEREADDENGKFQYRIQTERTDWHNVTHRFTNYRRDLRYITLEYGVDMLFPMTMRIYREITYRPPSSKLVAVKIFVDLPDLSESTTSE